jgi:ArsR family transcriptional regulator
VNILILGSEYMELIQILKALGDENRIRILNLLRSGKLCVCEIEHILDMSQSNASRHLEKLRNVNLITYEKRAQWVYYRLNDALINNHLFIKELLNNEFNKIEVLQCDNEKLKAHKDSGIACDELKKECKKKK